jgi:putative aldouronate transport system permease protein
MVRLGRSKIRSRSLIADILIYFAVLMFGISTIVPFLHVFNMSVSSPREILGKAFILLPHGFELESYRFIFRKGALLRAYQISIFVTVVGTALNLFFTATAAYALSKEDLPGRKAFMMFITLTIVLQAGIIPEYMLFVNIGLIDSIWSLVAFNLVNGYNLILMRNFFSAIPKSLIESAKLDGAKEMRILFQIIIPLSVPAMITIGLFYAVARWNEFFRAIMFINSSAKWPLQVVLKGIVTQADFTQIGGSQSTYIGKKVSVQTIQGAAIMAATIPMLILYPFLQKYFNKGIVLGAVKE